MNMNLEEIARITGGDLWPKSAKGRVSSLSTDSRTIEKGDLFIPLRGDNFDGHDYLAEAVARGAAACLCEDLVRGLSVPVIHVRESLHALGDIAANIRQSFSGPVVAVTGSSGKTTTREMLAAILSISGSGLKTEGNFNNLIGLPKTLLRLQQEDEWIVLELGMNRMGEIARLTDISTPDVGIITNVAAAHLQWTGGIEGVARAKGELFAGLKAGTTAVINNEDDRARGLPVANGVGKIFYSTAGRGDVLAENIQAQEKGLGFDLLFGKKRVAVRMDIVGRHNVSNALAAATAALIMDVPLVQVVEGLQAFQPIAGRLVPKRLARGIVLYDDSYNANPLSMTAALQMLGCSASSGRRWAVLGDMRELGQETEQLHRQVGTMAVGNADFLVVLGEDVAYLAHEAGRRGMKKEQIFHAASHRQAVEFILEGISAGDSIVVKGSRAMKMETISQALEAELGDMLQEECC